MSYRVTYTFGKRKMQRDMTYGSHVVSYADSMIAQGVTDFQVNGAAYQHWRKMYADNLRDQGVTE